MKLFTVKIHMDLRCWGFGFTYYHEQYFDIHFLCFELVFDFPKCRHNWVTHVYSDNAYDQETWLECSKCGIQQ